MARNTQVQSPLPASLLIETTQLVRQSHAALKGVNHLLTHSEEGTEVSATDLACLLLPIQERMDAALDELQAACRRTAAEV